MYLHLQSGKPFSKKQSYCSGDVLLGTSLCFREKGLGDSDEALEESSGHFFNRFYNSLRRIRRVSGKNCGCDPAMHEECGCRSSVPTVRRIPPEITQGIRVAVDKLERVEDTGRRYCRVLS
ncbi:unnamed protein product [Timema podura]|uniref:Uncharacterized protein n=1 Tax=Timema podura TaxID=61482 RepID=A0ABN7PRK9_TIMPD|nr:unnamed protein product [Timema podura]